jgi:molybdopterin-containing oxidoreductase family membrane subunit
MWLCLKHFHTMIGEKISLAFASLFVVLGGHAFMYVFIIGGEAFPIEMFPGKIVSSSFADGAVVAYTPSWPEFFLGLGGYGIAGLLMTVAMWALPILPGGFPDEPAEPATRDLAPAAAE